MAANWSHSTVTAIRLQPGDDLKARLSKFAIDHELEAAAIVTAVGSLSDVYLRLANQSQWTRFEGKREIVSLAGTLSKHGVHLHMCVSDSLGATIGGHVVDGSIVYTTAEIVIVQMDSLVFRRSHCSKSGYAELVVDSRAD